MTRPVAVGPAYAGQPARAARTVRAGWKAGVALVVATVLALLGGCGVPAEDQPRAVTPPPVPFPSTATAAPTAAETGAVTEVLYFSRDERLVPVIRRADQVPALDAQLRALLAGPTPAERDDGLTSALPGAFTSAVVELVDGLARVTVGLTAVDTGRIDGRLAYGQIVCTLSARTDVTAVLFLEGGTPLSVPRADGSLSSGPLTAADYAVLINPR
ncbi:GerMN domain-containing protein [Verrucosispora sp. WMMD703]|uniref:GerMN domain-containing protein n=1 Tax=unclassified Micromonospora TaxID=2617518 RepID=UPI00249A81D8|nr:GerMN domain-containing protein [Verrucosispora sp. WMMD1129]WFE48313.1 GerMN domain-containing protein [Verrucosispora sp. WMMD1129]